MTEKKFLSSVLIEGILLTALGLAMLMLPKITSLTFGITLCVALFIYGIYKTINAFMTRAYSKHFVLDMVLGVLLAVIGVFLFMAPTFNLVLITALIGVYFLLESLASMAFAIQTRKLLYMWWAIALISIMQFLLGLIIIMGLPATALWVVGVLVGVNFLIAGMTLISLYLATKYAYDI